MREVADQQKGKKCWSQDAADGGAPAQRRCGRCGETGHNARTCKKEEDTPSESDSSQ